MDGLNEVKLIGNVGKDVELKHLDNDKKVARIVLATNKSYKKQNGEKESRTEWHNIELWGDTAQFCANYVKKGMLLYVCGEIRTDMFEKDGVKQIEIKQENMDQFVRDMEALLKEEITLKYVPLPWAIRILWAQ